MKNTAVDAAMDDLWGCKTGSGKGLTLECHPRWHRNAAWLSLGWTLSDTGDKLIASAKLSDKGCTFRRSVKPGPAPPDWDDAETILPAKPGDFVGLKGGNAFGINNDGRLDTIHDFVDRIMADRPRKFTRGPKVQTFGTSASRSHRPAHANEKVRGDSAPDSAAENMSDWDKSTEVFTAEHEQDTTSVETEPTEDRGTARGDVDTQGIEPGGSVDENQSGKATPAR